MTSIELAPLVLRHTSKRVNYQGIHPNSTEMTKLAKRKLKKELNKMSMRNRGKKRRIEYNVKMYSAISPTPITNSMRNSKSSTHI